MQLHELVNIASGLQVSTLPAADYQPVPKPVQLLQLSDFSDDGVPLPPFRNQVTSLPPSADKHLLRPGQVLLTAKGARLFATCVQPDWLPALASTSFFVLTVEDSRLLPEYLTLLLNMPTTRETFWALFTTTTIPTLSRRSLLTLELPELPPLAHQHRAVEFHRLWLREKALTTSYLTYREQLVFGSLTRFITA